MMKKLSAALLCLALIFVFSSCAEEEPIADEEGQMMFITADEIGLTAEGREGFFVKNEDGTFTPIMNQLTGYQGVSEEASPVRYLWFTNNQINLSNLIPVVTEESPLVMIYDHDKNMPQTYYLEKYAYRGYTIGCHIYREPDNSLYFSTEGYLSTSNAGESVSEVSGDIYRISTINGSDILPHKNVDNNMQLLLGLEKDKYYDFEFYQGTKYRKLTTIADTMVLQSEDMMILNNPYTKTKEGYFIINLPDNLKSGYYYICGLGLFRYED